MSPLPALVGGRKRREDATRMRGAGFDPAEPRPHLVCLGCGERYVMALPMVADMVIAITRTFVKLHRNCKAPDGAE